MNRLTLLICTALVAVATGAQAQTAAQSSPRPASVTPIPPAVDGSAFRTPLGLTVAEANALRAAGVVQTSVDHSFGSPAITGSFGFLCGLQPSAIHDGIADARGYDPDGKFVGAKLAFAFK